MGEAVVILLPDDKVGDDVKMSVENIKEGIVDGRVAFENPPEFPESSGGGGDVLGTRVGLAFVGGGFLTTL